VAGPLAEEVTTSDRLRAMFDIAAGRPTRRTECSQLAARGHVVIGRWCRCIGSKVAAGTPALWRTSGCTWDFRGLPSDWVGSLIKDGGHCPTTPRWHMNRIVALPREAGVDHRVAHASHPRDGSSVHALVYDVCGGANIRSSDVAHRGGAVE